LSKIVAKYLSFFLIGLLLVGNTGLSLTTVLCHCKGLKIQTLSASPPVCCSHDDDNNDSQNQLKSCCSAENGACAIATAPAEDGFAPRHCHKNTRYHHLDQAQQPEKSQLKAKACTCTHCHSPWLALPLAPSRRAIAATCYDYAPVPKNTVQKSARSNAPPLRRHKNSRALLNDFKNYRC
jgi:hypothetical protein